MWNLANWGKVLISLIVVLGFFAVLLMMLTQKLNGQATPEVMLVMLGALGQGFGQVLSYWVGSSQSSSSKDEQIKEIVANKAAS
jgi:protein-S-isoprenylcysteine O-methyltransferase Ste14